MHIRTAFVFLIVAAAAIPAQAQSIGGGLKIGGNVASVAQSADADEEIGTKGGLIGGGYLTVNVTDRLAFQPELLFSQKGGDGLDGADEFAVNLSFLQVPTLLRVNVPTAGTLTPFLVVGPAFGFRTGASIEFAGQKEDIEDGVAGMEMSGIFGAGLQIGRALVEARYDYGFNDLDEEDDDNDARSRTFSVLVGIGFGQ
jgi:hypothetical protein